MSGSPFLVLDFGFHIVDSVGRLDLEGDGLSCECFDEYLHLTWMIPSELVLVCLSLQDKVSPVQFYARDRFETVHSFPTSFSSSNFFRSSESYLVSLSNPPT